MAYISSQPRASQSLFAAIRSAMGPRKAKNNTAQTAKDISSYSLIDIRQQISIPVPEQSKNCEEEARLLKAAHLLARQDRWDTIGQLIRQHDKKRTLTCGGTASAEVLTAGARRDLSDTITLGLIPRSEIGLSAATDGVEMLDQVLIDHSQDYGVALVVANAHMDLGSVWRGQGWADEVPASDWKKFARHYRRASGILEKYDQAEIKSPALAAALCRSLSGQPDAHMRRLTMYEKLIALAPNYAQSYRDLGNSLLPRRHGDYDLLEDRARYYGRTKEGQWGDAAYALVYMDAALEDGEALAHLDVAHFLKGLNDYLCYQPDQATVNKVVAYLAVSLVPTGPLVAGSKRALQNRRALIAAAPELARTHLRKVHPDLWARASHNHDDDAPPAKAWRQKQSGLEEAFSALGRAYERELLQGMNLKFQNDQVDIHAA